MAQKQKRQITRKCLPQLINMVGTVGFEPTTPCTPCKDDTHSKLLKSINNRCFYRVGKSGVWAFIDQRVA